MSKKIGVITVHKNVNYGANLQAFASCKYLNKMGYDCKVIDYTLPEHEKSNHLMSWLKQSWDGDANKSLLRRVKLAVALALSAPWKKKRLSAFYNFRKKYMRLTSCCQNLEDVSRLGLDTIVCGSDQIWNPVITQGVAPIFYGQVAGIEKRISYAASLGRDKFSPEEEMQVKDLVRDLDYCSVREENTAKYISELTGRAVETVCDPVFLLDVEDYMSVATKRLIRKDYVLLYSVVHDDALTMIARDYSDKHGLPLIEICAGKTKGARHTQKNTYGPSEFLSAFQYAKTVFTNSFHGTAFAIIFEKDFYIVDNKAGGSRITSLLRKVGLLKRLISDKLEEDFAPIDYQNAKNLLRDYIKISKQFLEKALEVEKKPLAGNTCMSCGACKAVCKLNAIRLMETKEGFLTSLITKEKCIDCGICKSVCPALNAVQKNQKSDTVYAFKANEEIRKHSTSGGAFAAMAEAAVEKKGAFYGAMQMADFSVKHIRGESIEDIRKLQGTKYLPSNMTKCYQQVAEDLKQGKLVLFSGTPCQVDAINRFVALQKLPKDNFYTVDIICHGVPSPAFFQSYMKWLEKEFGSKIVEYKFRSKKISWRGSSCYAKLKNGKELLNERRLCGFMSVYYSNNITRESCYVCPYTSTERVSDITISDCWGLEDMVSDFEDSLGVSMVMINTEKGKCFLESMQGERVGVNLEKAKQPQLKNPIERPHTRESLWMEYEQKGVKPLLKKYGGVQRAHFKELLSRIKRKF